MNHAPTAVASLLMVTALAGCTGGDSIDQTMFSETGRTVEIKMWVEDLTQTVFPDYDAAFWAFCAEGINADGVQAVEYQSFSQPCSVPGPQIRVNQGDLVKVQFENPHMFPHTIHWHGQFVPNLHDGVPGVTQDTVMPSTSFTYEFIASREGTLMYHCHVDTQHHVVMGLYGSFIVEPQNKKGEPHYDRDYTLVLSHSNTEFQAAPEGGGGGHDHGAGGGGGYGTGNPGSQNGPLDLDYDLFMVNGKSFPLTIQDPNTLIKLKAGETVRIRLVNIGFLSETMHLHGHDMEVTHKDGVLSPFPIRVDTLRIDPGERYDVIVHGDHPGKWVFHTHYSNHVTNDNQYPGGMLTQLVYEGFEEQSFDLAEQPGGGARNDEPEVELPDDFSTQFSDEVTDAQYSKSFNIPVEIVEAFQLNIDITLQVGSPLDEFTFTLNDADGNELKSKTLDNSNDEDSLTIVEFPNAGTYTLDVSGNGVQASYTADVLVQYANPHAGHEGH